MWCASPLVNPTTDAIYKPPKPTLEVTCQTQSQTFGGRKSWLDRELKMLLNTSKLLEYASPATATPPPTVTAPSLKSPMLTHKLLDYAISAAASSPSTVTAPVH